MAKMQVRLLPALIAVSIGALAFKGVDLAKAVAEVAKAPEPPAAAGQWCLHGDVPSQDMNREAARRSGRLPVAHPWFDEGEEDAPIQGNREFLLEHHHFHREHLSRNAQAVDVHA